MIRAFAFQTRWLLPMVFLLVSCSNSPTLEFTPERQKEKLRGNIETMREQWRSEKCPSNASISQCREFLQSGLRHCMNRNPAQKTRCVYNELYCTLFGGKACRF